MSALPRDMCVLVPRTLTDAMLSSSSVYEVAPAAYAGGTTYALNAVASVAGTAGLITVYKSLQASNTGHTPASSPTWWKPICTLYQAYSGAATYALGDRVQDNTAHLIYESAIASNTGQPLTDATKWLPVSATNVWAAFDNKIGTATVGASPLVNVLRPGSVAGLAMFEVGARTALVVMKDVPGGTVVYTRAVDMDGSFIESIYDWFFAEFELKSDVVLTDLPSQFTNCELTVTLTTTSGDASIGVLKPGQVFDIGATKSGAKVGIVSYTKKSKNEWGDVEIVARPNSKKASFSIVTEKAYFNSIYRRLAALDATLCVFIGTRYAGYEPLLVYGYFTDFSIDVEYALYHLCNLEVEGVI